tara:strand:- start:2779 stop:3267 length:489 start_codon:yes stop_codon:yes gene_type:complete
MSQNENNSKGDYSFNNKEKKTLVNNRQKVFLFILFLAILIFGLSMIKQDPTFQKTIIVVAIILLIGALMFFGVTMKNAKSEEDYPPVVAKCPDYWVAETDEKDEKKTICKNVQNLGNKSCQNEIDFSEYTNLSSNCDKNKWAKMCNLNWEGITDDDNICIND